MGSGALDSFAVKLKMGDGATPEVFTEIAELGDVTGPELSADMEDITNHGSTNEWAEQMPTIKRVGDISFPIQFIPTNTTHSYSAGLAKKFYNKTLTNFQYLFPDSTTWTFAAYVTKFAIKGMVKGILTADISLSITGQPTLA